jgi:branched-chain amino acid transport system ATP-binding protein
VTVIVIDHVISAIRALASRVVMLHHGEKCAEGPVETIFSDRSVIDAYLGAEDPDA